MGEQREEQRGGGEGEQRGSEGGGVEEQREEQGKGGVGEQRGAEGRSGGT